MVAIGLKRKIKGFCPKNQLSPLVIRFECYRLGLSLCSIADLKVCHHDLIGLHVSRPVRVR